MGTKTRKFQTKGKKESKTKEEKHAEKTANSTSERTGLICALLLWLFSLVLYVYTLYPSVPGGDSGELITAAQELGVAHPPGYPLFTILAWLAMNIIPLGSVAWRVNLLTAVLSSLAAFFFALTIYRITKSRGSAVLGVCFWCFSKLTWTWSITAEVFGMNNLFAAVLLYLIVCFQEAEENSKVKLSTVGAFVCALSLCNQHTMVLYVGVIGVWVLYELWSYKMVNFSLSLKIVLSFLLGLSPYIYLPLSAYLSKGRWTWGDQRTVRGFLTHILRQEYGTFNLGKDSTGAGLLSGLGAYGSHCLKEFSPAGLVFLAVGIFYAFKRSFQTNTRHLIVMLVMVIMYILFFTWRANLNVNSPLFLGVVERFWMQSDCVVVLFICLGYFYLFRLFESFLDIKMLDLVVALAVAGYHVQHNFSLCNQRNNTVVHEFGARLLENMPQNALVLTKGDLPSNTMRYLYLCENMRPDVKLFDQEVLTYEWSVSMMREAYPEIVFPGHRMDLHTRRLQDGTQTFNFETFLDANNKSTIVACIGIQDHESSWQKSYATFPYGPCQLLIKPHRFEVEKWIKPAQNLSAGWRYPFNGFEATSWERVATDEMWQAQISIAFALYNHALKAQSAEDKAQIMVRCYQLYTSAISEHPLEEIPTYWHKNYALVCERLLSLQHELPKPDLLDKAIFHFERLVTLDPTDDDHDAIVKAIKQLKAYRKN